jgi:CBS domain containing-hemolysin-like protein
VNNAEMVARRMVPIINVMAVFLSPVGKGFSYTSKFALTLMGFKSETGDAVSEEVCVTRLLQLLEHFDRLVLQCYSQAHAPQLLNWNTLKQLEQHKA